MTEIKALKERLRKTHDARMDAIYVLCEKHGLQRRYADSMYYRICQEPMKQTKTMIALCEDGNRYSDDVPDKLKQWKAYLRIMLESHPTHEMTEQWRQSLELIAKYKV